MTRGRKRGSRQPEGDGRSRSRARAGREWTLALLLMIAVAALLFRPLWRVSTTHILTDDFLAREGWSDAYRFLWGQWWAHTALSAGKNPYFCDWVFPPTGADLRFHTVAWVPAFLSWPLSGVVDTVRLYNLTIAGLLVAGGLVLFASLRHTFRVGFVTAVLVGGLFGFSPYFVFKAHVHPNLLGALLWGSALALLLDALVRGATGLRRAVAFSVTFWLCLWSSLVEVTMLAAATVVVVAAGAITRVVVDRRRLDLRTAGRWALVWLAGAPSLLFFLGGGGEGLERELFPAPSWRVWAGFPLLSLLSGGYDGRHFEYAGTGIPWGLGVLAALGLGRAADRRLRWLLGLTLAALGIFTFDPFRILSGVVRALPTGEGFRVFARFFPFALFFLAILAALGFDRAIRSSRPRARRAVALAALIFAGLEVVPRALHPSPVVSLNLPEEVRASLDESRYVLVLPDAPHRYPRIREAYQVELSMRFARMGYPAREDPDAVRRRAEAFPFFYEGNVPMSPAELHAALYRMGVGYLLFDQLELLRTFPIRGEVLHATPRAALLRLPPPPEGS